MRVLCLYQPIAPLLAYVPTPTPSAMPRHEVVPVPLRFSCRASRMERWATRALDCCCPSVRRDRMCRNCPLLTSSASSFRVSRRLHKPTQRRGGGSDSLSHPRVLRLMRLDRSSTRASSCARVACGGYLARSVSSGKSWSSSVPVGGSMPPKGSGSTTTSLQKSPYSTRDTKEDGTQR